MENKLVRNPKETADSPQTYDCEIFNVLVGWVPFTADKDDVEAHGREIYQIIVEGIAGEIEVFNYAGHWAQQFEKTKSELLRESEVSNQVYAELSEEEKAVLYAYRAELKALEYDDTGEEFTAWPTKPNFLGQS
jgi:hypothetical protein